MKRSDPCPECSSLGLGYRTIGNCGHFACKHCHINPARDWRMIGSYRYCAGEHGCYEAVRRKIQDMWSPVVEWEPSK